MRVSITSTVEDGGGWRTRHAVPLGAQRRVLRRPRGVAGAVVAEHGDERWLAPFLHTS